MLNRTRPVPAGELERRRELLFQLRTGRLEDVAPECLLDPRRGTRPSVRLVAHYDKAGQLWWGHGSVFKVLLASFAALAAIGRFLGLSPELSWTAMEGIWTSPVDSWSWWLADALVDIVLMVVVLFILFFLGLYVLGWLSWTRDSLTVDLNGLYRAADTGPPHMRWRDVIAVSRKGKRRIAVVLEDGGVLQLRVPRADRDWLVDVIRELLRHHHRDLYGAFELHPEPGETGHDR